MQKKVYGIAKVWKTERESQSIWQVKVMFPAAQGLEVTEMGIPGEVSFDDVLVLLPNHLAQEDIETLSINKMGEFIVFQLSKITTRILLPQGVHITRY